MGENRYTGKLLVLNCAKDILVRVKLAEWTDIPCMGDLLMKSDGMQRNGAVYGPMCRHSAIAHLAVQRALNGF